MELIVFSITLLAYSSLIVGSYFLRKDDSTFAYTHYLLIIGIGIFIFSFIEIFLPDAIYYSSTGSDQWKDVRYGFTYEFLRYQGVELALLVILGMSFVLIALRNRDIISEPFLPLTGINLALCSIFSNINWTIYYFLLWLWPQDFLIYYDFFVLWQTFNLFFTIVAYGLFIRFSVRFPRKYLFFYGVLMFCLSSFSTWQFIVSFEVFS